MNMEKFLSENFEPNEEGPIGWTYDLRKRRVNLDKGRLEGLITKNTPLVEEVKVKTKKEGEDLFVRAFFVLVGDVFLGVVLVEGTWGLVACDEDC